MKGGLWFLALLLLVCFPPAAGADLDLSQQRFLAQRLHREIALTKDDQRGRLVELHRRVIEQCPDTEYAQRSYWQLSNLYLHGARQPHWRLAAELLGSFVRRYPQSSLLPRVLGRLRMVFRHTGQHEQRLRVIARLVELSPKMPLDKLFWLRLEYAQTLEALGRPARARHWYRWVVVNDLRSGSPQKKAAQKALLRLKKERP